MIVLVSCGISLIVLVSIVHCQSQTEMLSKIFRRSFSQMNFGNSYLCLSQTSVSSFVFHTRVLSSSDEFCLSQTSFVFLRQVLSSSHEFCLPHTSFVFLRRVQPKLQQVGLLRESSSVWQRRARNIKGLVFCLFVSLFSLYICLLFVLIVSDQQPSHSYIEFAKITNTYEPKCLRGLWHYQFW